MRKVINFPGVQAPGAVDPIAKGLPAPVYEFEPVRKRSGFVTEYSALLNSLMQDREMNKVVRSHWVAYPHLREAAEALLRLLGPNWRANPSSPALIVECVEEATRAAVDVVQESGGNMKAVVSHYLQRLVGKAVSVAEYTTGGINSKGEAIEWSPLMVGLDEWIALSDVARVEVRPGAVPSTDLREGLKMRLLAQICSPPELLGMSMRQVMGS